MTSNPAQVEWEFLWWLGYCPLCVVFHIDFFVDFFKGSANGSLEQAPKHMLSTYACRDLAGCGKWKEKSDFGTGALGCCSLRGSDGVSPPTERTFLTEWTLQQWTIGHTAQCCTTFIQYIMFCSMSTVYSASLVAKKKRKFCFSEIEFLNPATWA